MPRGELLPTADVFVPTADNVNATSDNFDVGARWFDIVGRTLKATADTFDVSGRTLKATADTFDISGRTLKATADTFDVSGRTFEVAADPLTCRLEDVCGGSSVRCPGSQVFENPRAGRVLTRLGVHGSRYLELGSPGEPGGTNAGA